MHEHAQHHDDAGRLDAQQNALNKPQRERIFIRNCLHIMRASVSVCVFPSKDIIRYVVGFFVVVVKHFIDRSGARVASSESDRLSERL